MTSVFKNKSDGQILECIERMGEYGDVLAFEKIKEYLENKERMGELIKTYGDLLNTYIIPFFKKVAKEEKSDYHYAILDIVDAGLSLESIEKKENPSFRQIKIKLFQ